MFFVQVIICRFDDEVVSTDASSCQSGSFDRILCDVPCSGDGTLVGIDKSIFHSYLMDYCVFYSKELQQCVSQS